MKINIYYGGRGVLDDPTIYVLSQTEKVLGELRVEVNRYNIYEAKNSISTLPSTLKGVDGIILATTVEWLGIGGYMTQFLDACWLYGDKDEIAKIYMQPIVISTTYGEREAVLTLENAWQILGGQLCSGFCGYVDGVATLRDNPGYHRIIEKKAENLYRTISSHTKSLPSSNQAVRRSVLRTRTMQLTPQESEQLSEYASDDAYVAQQKEDIIELSSMYRNLLGKDGEKVETEFVNAFQSHFHSRKDLSITAAFLIVGREKPLVVKVNSSDIDVAYEDCNDAKVMAHLTEGTMNEITSGRMTFQRAFNTGLMTAKGTFADLRVLDDIFIFS
ncbi:MAG: SCP-2 sterol transfer family protein [Lachnospiraceae bacterium]|uniref:SCP-2 sterol transfer family protein n=1 Tax=Candidatus Weimeria bifida TaxID=2599074 RepID=A0A6N7J279_9FIRM|nr:SCP-2 sterol transfer family protein [Candidatus Weimeria bifida]RRF96839.1 MAG: SCP-2 sterol transfer family protein [Lachnospiraceae bacterium]